MVPLMEFPRLPLRFITKVRPIFRKRDSGEQSDADFCRAAFAVEAEKLSNLYESLALRVAALEANLPLSAKQQAKRKAENTEPMPKPDSFDDFAPEGSKLRMGWFRILRHMLPNKVRCLLFEHDHFQQLQMEVTRLQDQLVRERVKKRRAS